ncbi:EexN family lipoprotein [Bradyrhizobium sp. DOA9]|uniref:EexN family lipoprotein n=1 Tax=Bradyrhizobium sp. DOA9 TaxID=1126627 RepID=UPI0004684EE4|nr:EexN family lipoprotein [Bradyrhizobium sp. DOA9]GAJ37473.1 hypothetical protein BDOA9_0200900 [Bradyrhizobium sp. DOA9]
MTKKASILVIAVTAALTGCNETETRQQTKTVGWFFDHRDELQATQKACRDNPGERRSTPDCINANEARKKITVQEMKDALK